jgi:hypothetical protein
MYITPVSRVTLLIYLTNVMLYLNNGKLPVIKILRINTFCSKGKLELLLKRHVTISYGILVGGVVARGIFGNTSIGKIVKRIVMTYSSMNIVI